MMRYLIVGDRGYLGTNIKYILGEGNFDTFNRTNILDSLKEKIQGCDVIIHLAAIQRPKSDQGFIDNFNLTKLIVDIVSKTSSKVLIFTSSIHAGSGSEFGLVKLMEEEYIANNIGNNLYKIFRIPNTYGPHSKPNYNNVFSTFCVSVARSLPVNINNPNLEIKMTFVGLVINFMIKALQKQESELISIEPEYSITLARLLSILVEIRRGFSVDAPQSLIDSACSYFLYD